ncbi:MAG: hypothetical protein Q9157_008990, partial [Trypethelium eluteriae]
AGVERIDGREKDEGKGKERRDRRAWSRWYSWGWKQWGWVRYCVNVQDPELARREDEVERGTKRDGMR